tara:strand:+ start:708 stop:1313 length:606 start_codon:yes stop_codon:yes gene_type:complete
MYARVGKSVVDRLLALIAVVVLTPLLLLVAVVLTASLRGNPIFVQARGGFRGTVFRIVKFRTMTNEVDANGVLKSDAERLTRVGRFTRRLSLDELPQLVNVLKGDMSLIGPRPILTDYLPIYTERERHRHDVLPGITGLAQVNGRNTLTWKARFEYDLYYVENVSLMLDLKIVLMTVRNVLSGKGVDQDQGTTMTRYNGHN